MVLSWVFLATEESFGLNKINSRHIVVACIDYIASTNSRLNVKLAMSHPIFHEHVIDRDDSLVRNDSVPITWFNLLERTDEITELQVLEELHLRTW